MDGFGHDVAQKIKSAIKAKLVELDAYVDDELPDYIMVMVANKKPKAQMTEDLSLFLGDNTCKFTDWLHEVLQRLQSVTLDNQRKAETKPVVHEEIKNIDKSEAIEVVSTSDKPSSVKHSQKDGPPVESSLKAPAPKPDIINVVPLLVAPDAEMQDEMLTIKAEPESGDLLDEELRDDASASAGKPEGTKLISGSHSLTRPTIATSYLTKSRSKHDQETLPEKSKISGSESQSSSNNAVSVGMQSINNSDNLTQQNAITSISNRKRKIPCSTVGAVVQREFPQEEDDEEYDPRHPTIGAVASIVQVTQRRSSVPPERQANKLLLFKAVNEAERSVQRVNQRSVPAAVRESYEPTTQLFTRRYLERQKLEQQQASKQQQQQSYLVQKQIKPVAAVRKSPDVFHKNINVDISNGKEDVLLPISSPQKQDHVEMEVDEQTDENLFEEASVTALVEDPTRVVVLQERMEERPVSPKFIITLDGVDATAFESLPNDNQWSESGDYLVVNEDVASITSEQDELIVKEDTEANTYSEFMDIGDSQDLDYENGDEEYSISPNKKKKMNERCRYWPGCKNGIECTYYHPTTHCKTFPNCKFGSKCLYIHPNCKFDSVCTRRDCPFTHASPRVHHLEPATTLPVRLMPHTPRRPTVIPAVGLTPQKIKCRNFPACSNVDCPYYHPKPCRYGQSCTRSDCVFYHPPFPTPDKLKWNKMTKTDQQSLSTPSNNLSKKYTSERKFALNQVQQTMPIAVETIKT